MLVSYFSISEAGDVTVDNDDGPRAEGCLQPSFSSAGVNSQVP